MLKVNGFEKTGLVKLLATEIRCKNGSIIKAVASDYRGEAGGRQTFSVFDEIWAYDSERATRLWEEHQPIPTVPEGWVLVVTTAGFTNELTLLETLYQRGLAGERIDPEPELYRTGSSVMFWSHTPRQPWQLGEEGARYYNEQAQVLRPSAFARLHRNEWVSAESAFITDAMWDGCTEATLIPLLASDGRPLWIGLDIATKNDGTGLVGVTWDDDGRLRLACHRIWAAPVDLAAVERYLLSLHDRFTVRVVVDPFQALRTVAILRDAGVDIQEMPQTVATTTAMGEVLFDLLTHRQLRIYPAADLRAQALATTAIEHAQGMRIAKTVGSKKIDAISALAMACVSAVRSGPGGAAPLRLLFAGATEVRPIPAPVEGERGEREALWTVVAPVIAAIEQGDEAAFLTANHALEAHLAAVAERDPAAGVRVRAAVDQIEAAVENGLHA
jgi:phage terminase large subunit-like protein